MTKPGGAALLSIFLAAAPISAAGALATNPPITKAQQLYRNKPGNEFPARFTSVMVPEGITIMIDPDDIEPVVDPRNKCFGGTPRFRFLESINSRLPSVPGGPSPAQISQAKEGVGSITVDGRSVASMFHHLVYDHKVPEQQIWAAVKRSTQKRKTELHMDDYC